MLPRIRLVCFALGLTALLLAACDGDGGGGGSGGGATGGGATGGGGLEGVDCTAAPPEFPAFDPTCSAPADCVLKFHMVNCCGSMAATGVNQGDSAGFDAAEAVCQSQYPGCGCAAMPTVADDGTTSGDPAAFSVDCVGGQCVTSAAAQP